MRRLVPWIVVVLLWAGVPVHARTAQFIVPRAVAVTYTVCAAGCTFDNDHYQTALSTIPDGGTILLQTFQTYTAPDQGFVMQQRCLIARWDCITVRTGVTALGSVLSTSLFASPSARMTTGYRLALAKIVPGVNNSPAMRTVWPSETPACSPSCVGSGWTLKWLEFGPKSGWNKGKLILFGSNKDASDSETAFAHNPQDTLAEVPDDLSLIQCDVHGDPIVGQNGGLYLSSKSTRVLHNSFTNFMAMGQETQAITEINGVGPFTIENNLIQATGENFMFGGGDGQLHQSTTITGSPTSTSIVLTAISELYSGQFISVTHAGVEYGGMICTLTGSTCAIASAKGDPLPVTPSAGDTVKWNRMAGGITVRSNDISKPIAWLDPIIAAPTNVAVHCQTTGGTLTPGAYYYRVSALMNANGGDVARSASTAQVFGAVSSGATGSCTITWTPSVNDTGGSYIYGRTNAAQDTRWSVADGTATYTDTGSAGTADTPLTYGDPWLVKNGGEFKHAEGGGPAGPVLVEGNAFSYSRCCTQTMLFNIKTWNQDGSDVSSASRYITIRNNWFRHAVRCVNISSTDAEDHPSGLSTDITIENNLCADLSTAYDAPINTDSPSPIQITSGNYSHFVGSRGAARVTIQHNTFLPDTSLDRPLDLILTGAGDTITDLVWKNNIHGKEGNTPVRADIAGVGSYVPTAWTSSVAGSSLADYNLWADAASGNYTFSTHSQFPSDATLHSALSNYSNCKTAIYDPSPCALNGSSAYDNAGSDGTDLGANISAIKAFTDYALTGGLIPTQFVIEAEDFDYGVEGTAYHDTTTTNDGQTYRDTAVDIEQSLDTGGGWHVAYAFAGEWLNYTQMVPGTGTYTLTFRVASDGTGGTFHLEVDGVNVSGTQTVPNTLGWQIFTTLTKTGVALTAGSHVFKLVMDTNGSTTAVGNFNWIMATPQ